MGHGDVLLGGAVEIRPRLGPEANVRTRIVQIGMRPEEGAVLGHAGRIAHEVAAGLVQIPVGDGLDVGR